MCSVEYYGLGAILPPLLEKQSEVLPNDVPSDM